MANGRQDFLLRTIIAERVPPFWTGSKRMPWPLAKRHQSGGWIFSPADGRYGSPTFEVGEVPPGG